MLFICSHDICLETEAQPQMGLKSGDRTFGRACWEGRQRVRLHKPAHRRRVWNSRGAVFQSETQDYLQNGEFRFLGPAWNTLRQNLRFPRQGPWAVLGSLKFGTHGLGD